WFHPRECKRNRRSTACRLCVLCARRRFRVICAGIAAGRSRVINGLECFMKIGVPKETASGEKRVATTPEAVTHLKKLGFDVLVESGAGIAASFTDEAYRAAGAEIAVSPESVYADADIVLKVRAPDPAELERLHSGQVLISFL